MDWKHLAAAVALLSAIDIGGAVWEHNSNRILLEAEIAPMKQRHDQLVGEFLRQMKDVAALKAQSEVMRILKICAERPDVCEDN